MSYTKQGDCLQLMQEIPDGSIDMILCDLPYGTTACKWDSVIPFELLWEQYRRIIKKNGAIALFGAEPFSSALRLSNLAMYKYDWIWKKPRGTGFLNAKKQPLRDTENISIFYKKQCLYNPQMTEGTPYSNKRGWNTKKYDSGSTTYGTFYGYPNYDNPGTRYPKTVLDFGTVERGTLHPTQKPVALLEYLIRTYTNEGETVLDNCMGSGSTCIAAIRTGREYIGFEKDPGYYEIATDRIQKELVNR